MFGPTYRSTVGWSGPREQQNKTDNFLSVYGVMHVIVNSHKPKGKELRKWLLQEVIPRGFNKMIDAERQEKQQAIEEKEMQLALLNDDLTEAQEYARHLEYNNTGLQGEIRAKDQEIAHLQQRYVGYLTEEKKNYGMTVIAKNDDTAEFPYISICGQHGYRRQKKRMVMLKNPGSTELANKDTPNAIVTYNLWREHRLIETDPQRPRDFKLVNMDQNQLLQLA